MEYGSVAEWFSAAGTIGAVVITLVLLAKDTRKKPRVYVRARQNKNSVDIEATNASDFMDYIFWVVNGTNMVYNIKWCGIRIYKDHWYNWIRYNIFRCKKEKFALIPEDILIDQNWELLDIGCSSSEKIIQMSVVKDLVGASGIDGGKIVEFVYSDMNKKEICIRTKA
ncbi:hypothetical protein AB8175_000047 [Listeria monocytogenes]